MAIIKICKAPPPFFRISIRTVAKKGVEDRKGIENEFK